MEGQENKTNKVGLPTFLIVLSILSIIASVIAILYDISLMTLSDDKLNEAIKIAKETFAQMQGIEMQQEQINLFYKMVDNALYHFIFNVIEIIGLIILLTKRTIGFHIYAASQIGIAWLAYMAFGAGGFSIIFVSLMCILIYWNATRILEYKLNNNKQND